MAKPEISRRDRPDRQTLSYLDSAALIRAARQIAGLTLGAPAERLSTTQSAISNWERGRDEPRLSTLGRILQACGFEADLTFRRHDDVDRAQLRRLLDYSPDERLEQLEHLTDLLGLAEVG